MRQIGKLPSEERARGLSRFLTDEGITNEVELIADGQWAIWVIREDALATARAHFSNMLQAPENPLWKTSNQRADVAEARIPQERIQPIPEMPTPRSSWHGRAPLTWFMIFISVAIMMASVISKSPNLFSWLAFNGSNSGVAGHVYGFSAIRHGQLWRVITPIFLHTTPIHILFNMLWLCFLGGLVEARQGSRFLAVLVVVLAIISNCAQCLFGGPIFGGMSGIIYGLFGYVWIRGRIDRTVGYQLGNAKLALILVLIVLSSSGYFGPVDLYANVAGIIIGSSWGAMASPVFWRRLFRAD